MNFDLSGLKKNNLNEMFYFFKQLCKKVLITSGEKKKAKLKQEKANSLSSVALCRKTGRKLNMSETQKQQMLPIISRTENVHA